MGMALGAVITADIVNSTGLSGPERKKLLKELGTVLGQNHEFYRGDSFQAYVKGPVEALRILFSARTTAMKLIQDSSEPVTDIRACIGIGAVRLPVRSLQTASDEAFVLSGRAFDQMEAHQRLQITCHERYQAAGLGFGILARFSDYIFQKMTSRQAAVVFELLMNRTQNETARRLKRSPATIHKHTQAAGWPEIENLLSTYELLIDTIE